MNGRRGFLGVLLVVVLSVWGARIDGPVSLGPAAFGQMLQTPQDEGRDTAPDQGEQEPEPEDDIHPLDLLDAELRDPSRARRPKASAPTEPSFDPRRPERDFGPITMVAASSLQAALKDGERDLERLVNRAIDFQFAPSAELVAALRAGEITADVAALSDPAWFDLLATDELIEDRSRRTFAWNSLLFVQGPGRGRRSSVRFTSGGWPTAARIALQFSRAGDLKVVIVDPETSTEGAAAKRALETSGLWSAVEARLSIVADSAAAAAALHEGEAAFGLIYGTTARLSPRITKVVSVPLRETGLVRYQASAFKDAHPDGWRLVEALRGGGMSPHWRRYGFLPPEEGRLNAAAQRDAILSDPLLDFFDDPDD